MKVGIHANISDSATRALVNALYPVRTTLSRELEANYGGLIEHLWIDVELLEDLAREDGGPRHPFRFQKRVSGRSQFGGPDVDDSLNVGHFSVRPDFALLRSLPLEEAVSHVLQQIFIQSAILLEKQKKLGGFDAKLFRERLLAECQRLGYLTTEQSYRK